MDVGAGGTDRSAALSSFRFLSVSDWSPFSFSAFFCSTTRLYHSRTNALIDLALQLCCVAPHRLTDEAAASGVQHLHRILDLVFGGCVTAGRGQAIAQGAQAP